MQRKRPSLISENSRGNNEIKNNIIMQLEENKDKIYIQNDQINEMNDKIKDLIGVKFTEEDNISNPMIMEREREKENESKI